MRKQDENQRNQVEIISLDQIVPKDHLVRKIDKCIDFDFIYDRVKDLYSDDNGRPSLDPVLLFKIPFIQYLFGIKSMRQTIKEIETNVAYRWFLGLGLNDDIPHFTTFGKNYARRFEGTKVFEYVFNEILRQAIESGYVKPSEVFIDGTHVKASANKNKKIKEKTINKSSVDPDAGLFYKNEFERMFCYNLNTACDRNGFILGFHLSSGNVHDSVNFIPIFDQIKSKFSEMKAVVADAGYVTPYITKHCFENQVIPVLPYKKPMTKKEFFKKHEYVYDEYFDVYICPNNQTLKYARTDRGGYKIYKSKPDICKACPYLNKCTKSRNQTKVITRHIWTEYLEEANHLRHTSYNKELYSKRSQTIERVFVDFKEKHSMRYTHYRRKGKVRDEAMLAFACMNMKKISNWKWKKVA